MQLKKTDGTKMYGTVVPDVAGTEGADKLTPEGLARRQMEAIVKCMSAYSAIGNSLDRIDLQGLDLAGGQFPRMELNEANFSGTDLSTANFHGADLRGANLSGANLENTIFREADLRGANLRRAKIRCTTDFRDTRLEGADLTSIVIAKETPMEFILALAERAYPNLSVEERMRILLPPRELPSIELAQHMELDRLAAE
jgi:hypothetical protein